MMLREIYSVYDPTPRSGGGMSETSYGFEAYLPKPSEELSA